MSEFFEQDQGGLADEDLAALYRQTRNLEPPPRLDSRILAAAREAARPRKARRFRRWAVPLSMAAVLVLAVGLVSLMKQTLSPDEQTLPFSAKVSESIHPAEKALPSAPAADESVSDRQFLRLAPGAPRLEQESGRREPLPPPAEVLMMPMEESIIEGEAAKREQKRHEPLLAPEVWLEHINELRRQGRDAEAEANLRALRRHYPDYPVSLPEAAGE